MSVTERADAAGPGGGGRVPRAAVCSFPEGRAEPGKAGWPGLDRGDGAAQAISAPVIVVVGGDYFGRSY